MLVNTWTLTSLLCTHIYQDLVDRDLSEGKREQDQKRDTDTKKHPQEVKCSCMVLLHAWFPGHVKTLQSNLL